MPLDAMDQFRLLRFRAASSDPVLHDWMIERFFEGRDLGLFDRVMEPPDGSEECIVITEAGAPPTLAAFLTHYRPLERRDFVWVQLLWVDPSYRRRGLATRMLKDLSDLLPAGAEIGFGSMTGNAPMRALAAKLGFAEHSLNFRTRRAA
jgi:GNAT superfamily N-acetyltransferase